MSDHLLNFINEAQDRRAVIADKFKRLDQMEAGLRGEIRNIERDRAHYLKLDAEYAEAIERAKA